MYGFMVINWDSVVVGIVIKIQDCYFMILICLEDLEEEIYDIVIVEWSNG